MKKNITETPLTDPQRGIYYECIENPQSTMYNMALSLTLPTDIDLERFAEAVDKVIVLHPALTATIFQKDGEPWMKPFSASFHLERTTAANEEEAKKRFIRPYDLERGPLCRIELCRLPNESLFLLDVHHIVGDGSSMRIILKQIADAYMGREIPDETKTIFEVAQEEETLKESPQYAKAQEFFRNSLKEVEWDGTLMSDVARESKSDHADLLILEADWKVGMEELEEFLRKESVTKNTLFMSAYAYTLAHFKNTAYSCFTTAVLGRHGTDLDQSVGMFVRTLPLYIKVDENESVSDFLHEVQNTFRATRVHDCISFGELYHEHHIMSDTSFVYQSDLLSEIQLGETFIMPQEVPMGACPGNLIFSIVKSRKGFELRMRYRTDVYSKAYMESIAHTMIKVAEEMLSRKKLSEIDLVGVKERAFIDDFNRTEQPFNRDTTIAQELEKAIQQYPDKEMLIYEDRRWTYAEFDRITKQIAAYVHSQGIGKDNFVAVLAQRCDWAVIAAWGTIRAGAAFQTLDPTYPRERLNYMIGDSGAQLLIADRSLINLVDEYKGKILFIDEIQQLPAASDFQTESNPENAVTMIYTSGTTGKPKGCVLEDRNMLSFWHNHQKVVHLNSESRVASFASFGFDAGIMDLLTAPLTGATLCIIPDEIRNDLLKVNEFYCQHRITFGAITTQVGRMFAEITTCPTLESMMVGGEKLVPFNPPTSFRFLNGYGPCETMAYICCHHVTNNSSIQPIGKPSGNTRLYVRDKQGRLLPPGAIGELCISGLQVGRGYLGMPEKTSEVFVKNPYTNEKDYERMYCTGDMVRLLPAGELEFIGRKDGQVKIRGFRVELTEVEEVIRRFTGIKDATVMAYDEPNGGKYLAAFVVGEQTIDIEALHAFIQEQKPPYMVPAVTTQIEAIPYTQNQKVDKRALPVPQRKTDTTTFEKPENEIQQRIYDIAKEILGHDTFGISTNLFQAGLTSISTLKFNLSLSKAFEKPLNISDLKTHNTIRKLETFLQESKEDDTTFDIAEDYPIMQNQMGVFVECGMKDESIQYNIPMLLRLSDRIDTERLRTAICKAIDAHPYIKAVLTSDKMGRVRACRQDDRKPTVELVTSEKLPDIDSIVKPFVILDSPLYRAYIYQTYEGKYLFLDFHHIIADGTSLNILFRDISAAYLGESISKETFTGYEAALEEERKRASEELKEDEVYYEKILQGCNTDCLPQKCPKENVHEGESDFHSIKLSTQSTAILDYCRENNLTPNAFFNAVFSYTLSTFLHASEVTYCTVYNGRDDSRFTECFAMLVKTLPVVANLLPEESPLSFVKRMQEQLAESMSHTSFSFAEISKRFNLKSDIFFNYQGDDFSFDSLGGEKAELLQTNLIASKAPITMEVFLQNGIFQVNTTYRTDIFCQEFITSFAEAMATATTSFLQSRYMKDLSIFSAQEKEFFSIMNATEKPFRQLPAQDIIEEWATLKPNSVAVKTEKESLTYSQLDEMSNRLANALIQYGVKADEIVGLILERSEYVPVAEIGILKSGGAFLPMLPSYPDDRLNYCMENADCRFVIATHEIIASHASLFAPDKKYHALAIEDLLKDGKNDKLKKDYAPDQLAYCIYTSGSTGLPKGVMIEHHNLSNFVQTAGLIDTAKKGNTMLCMSSITFDMSVCEIFLALCYGKTAYIASENEIHNLDILRQSWMTNEIDMAIITPSFAWNLLSLPDFATILSGLKAIVLGAEAFQPNLYDKLKALNPNMLIQNGYGPTECTMSCSAKTLTDNRHITIGGPYANTKYYVMDPYGHLLPRYAVGELIICGEGVGRGYVKLPEKTAEVFFEIEGHRAYHSGDLVRINNSGEAEFGGRTDNQVKLRGFRVELDEIENVMQEFKGVIQSKVIVRNNGTEDFLAGFFTADRQVEIDELTTFMKKKLTYYMVPSALMQLDKMPITTNGKIDKKALPEIHPIRKTKGRKAPRKSLEEQILGIFRAVLNTDECYMDDNFFEMGGTSLSASNVVMQLKANGWNVEYQDIFDNQTAEELADFLNTQHKPSATEQQEHSQISISQEEKKVSELLKYNTMEYAPMVERHSLGNVLLSGATGFLGCHILRELIDLEEGHIYCLMRRGKYKDVATRLKAMLFYYFEDSFDEAFVNRITVLEGDITDEFLSQQLKDIDFQTLINCAACVKHFANDNSIEFVNVHGVENLISIAQEKKARMIQISTTSIPGAHNQETYKVNLRMTEDRLFVVDDMNNQYVRSKYQAELLMLEAIRGGLKGKIIRVGNLMGRYSDGEFQTNLRTNAFLNGLRGFVAIGKCPISHSTDSMSFSPIDSTARAVVLLAGTNDMFTAFNADSRSSFDEMKIIAAMNDCGVKVIPVKDEEYYDDFKRILADPEKNERVLALFNYDRPDVHMINTDNRFTANILYRLGFSWPFIDDIYLRKVIHGLDTMGFFLME